MKRVRVRGAGKKAGIGVALIAASAIAIPFSNGSSHREAPNIMLDPSADNTDVYAFTAPDAPDSITVAADWIPGQVPANGPNFFRFDDRARYYINFDNTGDGDADIRYRFDFATTLNDPNSYLYSKENVQDFNDPGLNERQTYSVTRETYKNGKLKKQKTVAKKIPVPPSNIGPKTFPNYANFEAASVSNLPGGGKVFAGQRDDPFFVDLGAAFDSINLRAGTGNTGLGKDDFSDYSTSAIVLQLPESLVTNDGKAVSSMDASNAVVGSWASTERRKLEVTNSRFDSEAPKKIGGKSSKKGKKGKKGKKSGARKNDWVQVSRLANPLVNELLVPLAMKDKYNRLEPSRDPKFLVKYLETPELAAQINRLFPVNAPEQNRDDLIQAVLQGIPGLNEHSGSDAGTPVDTLKLNLGVAPTNTPNRFGVIAGDNAGFPNGRRLADDATDIDIQVVAGILADPPNAVARTLGDGVDVNDKEFLSSFPYLASPTSGFNSNPGQRTEPVHPPAVTGAGG